MRVFHLTCAASCLFAVAAAMIVAPAVAEPVQPVPVADAATVGLWRFQEGQGDRSASAVQGPAAVLHGATWVPGPKASPWPRIPDTCRSPTIRPCVQSAP